jgi:hypothetical protein
VVPVPDPYFSENLEGPEIELGTSGSVARDSDHQTTEAVDTSYSLFKNNSKIYVPYKLGYAIYFVFNLRSPQPLTEMGTRNLPGVKERPAGA